MALLHEGDPGPKGHKWLVVMASFGLKLIMSYVFLSSGIFYVMFTREIGGSNIVISLACSLGMGITALIGPLAGVIVDRFGCRKTATVGTCIGTSGFLLTIFVTAPWQLCLTFGVLCGIGNGMVENAAIKAIGEYFTANLNLAMNVACAGMGTGSLVFPLLMQYCQSMYGYKGTLLILSGLYLQGLVFASLLWPIKNKRTQKQIEIETRQLQALKTVDNNEQEKGEDIQKEKHIWTKTSQLVEVLKFHLLKNVHFVLYLLNYMLCAFGVGIVLVYTNALAIEKGFSTQQGAMLYLIYGISQTIAPFFLGLLLQSPKVGVLPVIMVMELAGAVCIMVYPILSTYWEMALFIGIISCFFSPLNCLNPLITAQLVGVENLAVGFGYTGVFNFPGSLLAGPIGGWLHNMSHQFISAYLVSGSAIIIAVALLSLVQFQCFIKPRGSYDRMD